MTATKAGQIVRPFHFMRTLIMLCLVSSLAIAAKPPKPPPPPPDGLVWTRVGTIKGFIGGNYTPVIVTSTGITVMNNGNGVGWWGQQDGTWASLDKSTWALTSGQIFDEPCGASKYCVRSSAIQRGPSGQCYAMLTVGNGYPTTDSYRPAWATSDDCKNWLYRGRILIEGSEQGYGQTDTAAMVVQEAGPDTPDHVNPGVNKYLIYENYQCLEGACPKLVLVYSADGVSWFRARDAFGALIDVWPAGLSGVAFPTAARTPYGFHVAGLNDDWSAMLHVFSCDGVHFRVVESASDIDTGAKGSNLAYDPATDTLHALTGGVHFQIAAPALSC